MKHEIPDINSDVSQLNLEFIHEFISNTTWAKDRTLEEIALCVQNSLNFGVYIQGQQVGYARVVTDYCVFAYLMDLFIVEEHRKKGYAALLMDHMIKHKLLSKVQVWRLATNDAHGLYKKFGFTSLSHPEKMMERKRD